MLIASRFDSLFVTSLRKIHNGNLFKSIQLSVSGALVNKRSQSFGKRFAVRIGDFERSIIDTSLTKTELKTAFKMMDENNGSFNNLLSTTLTFTNL